MSKSLGLRGRAGFGIQPVSHVRKRWWSSVTSNRRRRSLSLSLDLLEVRTLLSSQTVQLIKDVNAVDTYPSNLTAAGSNLFSLVEDSTNSGQELEATIASGTTTGLMDFPSDSSTGPGSPTRLTAVGNDLFFLTTAGSNSTSSSSNLWHSDGTTKGTDQVSFNSSNISNFQSLTALGNTLIVSLDAPQSGDDYQLWAIPSGNSSSTKIADFGTSSPTTIGTVGNTLYLSVGGDLWTTDGTPANTREVTDSTGTPIAAPSIVFAFNNQTYAFSNSETQTTIGVLGSSGLTPIATLASTAYSPVVLGSKFYFSAAGSTNNNSQLWASDGTLAGTQMLEDFSSVSSNSNPSDLTAVAGALFLRLKARTGSTSFGRRAEPVRGPCS